MLRLFGMEYLCCIVKHFTHLGVAQILTESSAAYTPPLVMPIQYQHRDNGSQNKALSQPCHLRWCYLCRETRTKASIIYQALRYGSVWVYDKKRPQMVKFSHCEGESLLHVCVDVFFFLINHKSNEFFCVWIG